MRKNYVVNFGLALVAAILVVFVYSRISGHDNAEPVTYQERHPAWFANLPDDYRPDAMDFTYAAEKTIHGVVHVTTTVAREQPRGRDPFFDFFGPSGNNPDEVEGMGSGVIITRDGYIVTNNHVIHQASGIVVTLNDGQAFNAEVVGTDHNTDIALLKIEADDLPYIEFGNSNDLRPGEWVLAVGNPMNLTSTVTAGIISAMARGLGVFHDRDMGIESFIQTDAPLNPGSSGGALVNLNGELIGIPTLILSPTGTYAGNSFAIPATIVNKVVGDIMEYGEVQRAVLGVSIRDVDSELAGEIGLERVRGVYVEGLIDGGAAAEAGMREGDVIVEVDDRETGTVAELQEVISQYRPDEQVTLRIYRNGEAQDVNVTLGRLEEEM
jgi:serine protease Do